MGNTALDVHAIKARPGTIGIAGQVHQRPLIQEDWISHVPIVRRDPFWSSAGWTDAPDIQFIGKGTLDEVDECFVGGPRRKVTVEPGRSSEDGNIARSPTAV